MWRQDEPATHANTSTSEAHHTYPSDQRMQSKAVVHSPLDYPGILPVQLNEADLA